MLAAAGGGLKKLSPFLGLCSSPPQTASEKGEIQMRAQEEQKQLPPLHSVARGPLFLKLPATDFLGHGNKAQTILAFTMKIIQEL